MNLIAGRRQSGKTTLLIKMSADGMGRIVEPTEKRAAYVQHMAKEMGLDIPEPTYFIQLLQDIQTNGRTGEKYLLDDVQSALGQLGITVATLDSSDIKYLSE